MNKSKNKSAFMGWIDDQLDRDVQFRTQVEEALNTMRIEQDLEALRQERQISQEQLAKMLGVSQPAIAKIESGKVKNLQLRTLIRMTTALGGTVKIQIVKRHPPASVVAFFSKNSERRTAMGKSKHDQIAERIARKEGTSYNRGQGPDIKTSRRVIEVATHENDLRDSTRQLQGFDRPRYLATTTGLVNKAKELTQGTKIGVMGPTGTIRKRAGGSLKRF